jgi:hypothetical protein
MAADWDRLARLTPLTPDPLQVTCPRPLSKDEKPDTKGKCESWWTGQES